MERPYFAMRRALVWQLPQSSGMLGGFKAQGRTADSALELIRDAEALRRLGHSPDLVVGEPVLGLDLDAEV